MSNPGKLNYMASQIGGDIAGGAATLREIRDSDEVSLMDRAMIETWILDTCR